MEDKLRITEKDVEQVIDFLNFMAKETEFKKGFDTFKSIQHYKLLNYMQSTIIPKMKANIFEVKRVVLPELPKDKE